MDELSEVVCGKRVSITLLYGPRYFAPIRYLALFFRTLLLLVVAKPDVVYAQSPPVFCPLTCLIYSKAAGKRLVVDYHTVWRVKTIGGPLGRVIGSLESFVARSAEASTAPHSFWAEKLREMGGANVLVVHDYVAKNPFQRDDVVRSKYASTPFVAIASHGGHPLERLEFEVEAASSFEDLTLLITGPASKLAGRLTRLPPNVKYPGMLPMDDYMRLKASCDFALNITDEPFTLSHVLFEYAASALPVVTNRQEVVEDAFGDSLCYVESSSVESITRGIREFVDNPEKLAEYRSAMSSLFATLSRRRDDEVRALKDLIMTGEPAKVKTPA